MDKTKYDVIKLLVVIHFYIVCGKDPDATSSNIAYVGETATIDCPLTDSYTYPTWYGPPGKTRYANTNNPDMYVTDRISYADNERDLIRTGVTKADGGTYECNKGFGEGTARVLKVGIHTLHVRVLPDLPVISNTEIIGVVLSVRGTEGRPLTLTCVCHGGFPAPTLAWYRDTVASALVASTPGTDGTSVTVTYTFTPGRNKDKNAYICQSSFTDSRPEPINQTSIQLYLNLKPSIPTVQQIGEATAGSNATLQCDTSGFRPQALTISWTYKGTVTSGSLPTASGLGNDKYRATSTLELPVQRGDNRGSVECIVTHSTLSSPLSQSFTMNFRFAPYLVTVDGNKQTVANGSNPLQLTCTVGDANPTVPISFTWTGPGGVGVSTSHTVTLTPTRDQDGAAVTCTAENTVGPTTSQAVMLDLTYHPNTTISEGTSITKTEGDVGFVLHCSTDSKPVSTITWSPTNNNPVIQGTNIKHLHVGTVDRTDYGTYTCSADNGITGTAADRVKSVTLNVLFPPLTVGLTGYTPGMVVNGANTLTLTCTADYSRPVSTIVWRNGSSPISASTSPVIPGSQYGGTRYRETLTLTPTRSDDGTNITCSVRNNVTAQPLPKTVQLDLRYRPEANIPGGDKAVIEGTPNIYLKCTASSKPVATFTWYKGTTLLGTDTGTLADNSGSYKINEVNRTDSGQYNCTASNGISPVDVQTMTLTVQYPPDVTATGHDGTVNDTSMTITCSASGVPDSYTYNSWMHTWSNGQVSSHQLDLAATQSLTLNNLTYKHSGIYTCRVSNGIAPYDTPAAFIREGSTPVITIKSNPVIIGKVDKVTTQLHEPTNFNITYYSNADNATVSVHRVVNNVTQSASVGVVTTETAVIQLPMIDNSTVAASGIRATVNLTIDHESKLGFYQMKLRNTIGTTTVVLRIQSKGPPEPPENPAVTGVSSTSVNVSWNLGFHGGLNQTFVVQYSTGGEAWTNGPTLYTGLNASWDLHHVSVDSLSPGQFYYLRMYAYNEMGQSDYTDTFNVTTSTPVTDSESSASTGIGPIVGGLVAALVTIAVVVGVVMLYKKGYRINIHVNGPGNKGDKYSAHVYENDFGTDKRKPPNGERQVPATLAIYDNGPPTRASVGTRSGTIYDEIDVDPQAGSESRDQSIPAAYEMLELRQSEHRTYEEMQLPAPPEYENLRIP